jgi:hypothetical protein
MSPQARAIQRMREMGYAVETVEQVKRVPGKVNVPGKVWRVDLFGAFDLLGVNVEGEVMAVQVTSRSNVSARVRKLADLPVLDWLRKAEWSLWVWGYGRTITKGEWLEVDIS